MTSLTNVHNNSSSHFDIRVSTFSTSPLDRLNTYRSDPSYVKQQLSNPKASYLIFSSTLKILTYHDTNQNLQLLFLTSNHFKFPLPQPILLLGKIPNTSVPYLTIQLKDLQQDNLLLNSVTSSYEQVKFSNIRSIVHLLPHDRVALLSHARSLLEFHTRHSFCGFCGSETISDQGGARRKCIRNISNEEPSPTTEKTTQSCKGVWFPRSDPVAIMLVIDQTGNQVLLGRSKRHSALMYSCLAGFMEHGEGIEDTVRREVLEESAVHVDRVRFFGSQPWPYPYSLMLGCIAEANTYDITIDYQEMADVQWFTREQVKEMRKPSLSFQYVEDNIPFVPPITSIAGQMLAAFVNEDPITVFEQSSSPNSML